MRGNTHQVISIMCLFGDDGCVPALVLLKSLHHCRVMEGQGDASCAALIIHHIEFIFGGFIIFNHIFCSLALKYGLWAVCGPRDRLVRPARKFINNNIVNKKQQKYRKVSRQQRRSFCDKTKHLFYFSVRCFWCLDVFLICWMSIKHHEGIFSNWRMTFYIQQLEIS